MSMYERIFYVGMRWGLFEQFTAQFALLAHQFFLYRACGAGEYGLISVTFSYVWLVSALLNFGFDPSLSSRFAGARQSRLSFWVLVVRPLCLQPLLLGLGAYVIFSFLLVPFWLLVWCTVLEGLRRSLRLCLQFSGQFREVSLLEFLHTSLYLLLVWVPYWYGFRFSLVSLLAPLALVNSLSVVVLACWLWRFYVSLPLLRPSKEPPSPSGLPLQSPYGFGGLGLRLAAYPNSLVALFFSSSFLVPLASATLACPPASAALAGYLAYFFGSLLKRSFGVASAAAFAAARYAPPPLKRSLFTKATSSLLACLLLATISAPLLLASCTPTHTPQLALLFFISLSEYLLLTYERFFLTEDQIIQFTIYNLAGCATVTLTALIWTQYPSVITALLVVASRITTIAFIAYLGYQKWGITITKENTQES